MFTIMKNNRIFIPIDFNSFSNINGGKLGLSDYYIDYAFYSERLEPGENMKVTFYDYSWREDKFPNEIMCLDAILRKNSIKSFSWVAELEGRIYTKVGIPKRKYHSSFIGANTKLHGEKDQNLLQKLSLNPEQDKLDGISCFVFPPETRFFPDFSKIIGMDIEELFNFFQFKDINPLLSFNDFEKLPDDALVVRGGNKGVRNKR